MTLIASLEIRKTPVLIGDLMLSQLGVEKKHEKLPTFDDASFILPIEWQRHISGIHRKASIVHPKVAVAWAGRLIYAAHFVYKLISILKGKREISRHFFENALLQCKASLEDYTSRNSLGPDDLTVIGILVPEDGQDTQFEWNWENFKFFEEPEIIARGSGSDDLLNFLANHQKYSNVRPEDSSFTIVALDSVTIVSNLLGEELSTGSNLPMLYGGGYDIVIRVGKELKYLNDILYVPIFLEDLEENTIKIHDPYIFLNIFTFVAT